MLNKMIFKPSRLDENASSVVLKHSSIRTVCQETSCPNITECFSKKEATYLILGNICTRTCSFCSLKNGKPSLPDPKEPLEVARSVKELELRHVIVTSPTRDDLNDAGAKAFCETVAAIKALDSSIVVELLISDMGEDQGLLREISLSGADIIGHNIETVPRLYHIRQGFDYRRSLRVLDKLHKFNDSVVTKSAFMLGLGESDTEIREVMQDLREAGCKYLNIAQYTAHSSLHTPVLEYVSPQKFAQLQDLGLHLGFHSVVSSPYE